MMQKIPNSSLMRDPKSRAVVETDREQLERYKAERKKRLEEKSRLSTLEKEVADLRVRLERLERQIG